MQLLPPIEPQRSGDPGAGKRGHRFGRSSTWALVGAVLAMIPLLRVAEFGKSRVRWDGPSAFEGEAFQTAERVSERQVFAAGRPFEVLGDGLPSGAPTKFAAPPSYSDVESRGALQFRCKGPEPMKEWPERVSVEGTPEVEVLPKDDRGLHLYRTASYQFECDVPLSPDAVRSFARVFEATHELNCLLPLGLRPTPERLRNRFVARLYSSEEDYFRDGGMAGSAGTYQHGAARIMVPISSLGVKLVSGRVQTDLAGHDRTLLHEITHQMMNGWLPRLPQWYAEGSAEWVAMADYIHGRFYLQQMEDQLREYLLNRERVKGRFTMLPPEHLMRISPAEWSQTLAASDAGAFRNYASAAVLTFFFYHWDADGKGTHFIEWLRAVERGVDEELALEEYLLRGRPGAELEQEITAGLAKIGVNVFFEL